MNPVAWGRTRKSPEDEENCHVIIHDNNFLWVVYTKDNMYVLRYTDTNISIFDWILIINCKRKL